MVAPLLVLVASLSVATGDLSLDAYQIFTHARDYWQEQHYPDLVDYTVHVSANVRGTPANRHYPSRWSALTNGVAIQPASLEEQQDPYKPAGFMIRTPIATMSAGAKGTGTNGDLLGVPLVAPNYSFDIAQYVPPREATSAEIVEEVREQFHDPNPQKVAQLRSADGPATIATVTAVHHDYDIRLAGIESYDGHLDYHLILTPITSPAKYRLRELWIDTKTFATDKLVNQGNFTDGPSLNVLWTVTFHPLGGAWYIATETACSPLKAEQPIQPPDVYGNWSMSFEKISPANGPFLGGQTNGMILKEPL